MCVCVYVYERKRRGRMRPGEEIEKEDDGLSEGG